MEAMVCPGIRTRSAAHGKGAERGPNGSRTCARRTLQSVAAGAPRENRNAVKRDFHGAVALAGEPEHLDGLSGDVLPSLDSEIALLAQRRETLDVWVQQQVEAGRQIDLLKYMQVLAQIGGRIARMLRDREVIGQGTDVVAELFDDALDRLSEEFEVDL